MSRRNIDMKKQLSRDEIDKLLGVVPTERVPTKTEIQQIEVAVEAVANERNIPSSEISTNEINEIVKIIGIKNVRVYSLDEILGNGNK